MVKVLMSAWEIVGPPGSGKTTLVRALVERHPGIRPGEPPQWRKPGDLPFFLRNGLAVAPDLARLALGPHRRRPEAKELAELICLHGWRRRFDPAGLRRDVAILDQGPVFMLAELLFFREHIAADIFFREKWRRVFERWGGAFRGLIRLDAADDVLAGRIGTRAKDHLIKGASDARAADFLRRSRTALARAEDMMRISRPPARVLSFDTGRQSLQKIMDVLAEELL